MAERASVFQIVQLGVESTAGTAVAATKKLATLEFEMGPVVDVSTFRPSGFLAPTVAALNKEWTEATFSGPCTYSEIVYPLSSLLETATITGAGTAKTWTFTPAASAEDTFKTFTIEQGSSERAQEFDYACCTGMSFKFDRSECTVEGTFVGQAMTDGITLTAGLSSVEMIPVMPTQVTVKLADTGAGLGAASALARALSVEYSIANRRGPVWALSGDSSWVADVAMVPQIEVKLLVEADSEGMGLLTTLRAGSTKFIRIGATGAAISGGGNYTLYLDAALKVTDVGTFSDEDGVYAIEWTFEGAYDATWTKWAEVTVINTLAAL